MGDLLVAVFYLTTEGYIGLGIGDTQKDGFACILHGCKLHIIGGRGAFILFIRLAYVNGVVIGKRIANGERVGKFWIRRDFWMNVFTRLQDQSNFQLVKSCLPDPVSASPDARLRGGTRLGSSMGNATMHNSAKKGEKKALVHRR